MSGREGGSGPPGAGSEVGVRTGRVRRGRAESAWEIRARRLRKPGSEGDMGSSGARGPDPGGVGVWRLGSRPVLPAAPLPAAPQSAQCALPVPAARSSSSSRFLLRSRSPMAGPAGGRAQRGSAGRPPDPRQPMAGALAGRWRGTRPPRLQLRAPPPAPPRPAPTPRSSLRAVSPGSAGSAAAAAGPGEEGAPRGAWSPTGSR